MKQKSTGGGGSVFQRFFLVDVRVAEWALTRPHRSCFND